MIKDDIVNGYFCWLIDKVCEYPDDAINYNKLFRTLHDTDFEWTIPLDANRAIDGEELRRIYAIETNHSERTVDLYINWDCSVLEMMVALADKCETQIMYDPEYGDRTAKWFWIMIENLGLQDMTNDNFDYDFVAFVLSRFMQRTYKADGDGGLFRLKNPIRDMRNVEIWYQLNWYLTEFLNE